MTTYITKHVKCAVCGTVHPFQAAINVLPYGPLDLDLRPPSPLRETMFTWVQECPNCGYARNKISRETSVNEDWLQSKAYKNYENHIIKSSVTRQFYHFYMNALHDKLPDEAAWALLLCAWESDTENDVVAARTFRLMTADLLLRIPEDNNTHNRMIDRMDLLRRAGEFDRLLQEYENYSFNYPLYRRIYRLQMNLARRHNDECVTYNMIFNNRTYEWEIIPDTEGLMNIPSD